MPLFHQIRKSANKVLAPLGLALERVNRQPWFLTPVVNVQVGRFSIQMPANSPLPAHYRKHPDYTAFLARLAALVKGKYPAAAALDIGANVGDTASIIRSGADLPLLCIEGDDLTFRFLERNLRQFPHAAAHKLFLAEKSEALSLSQDKSGWNTTLIPDQGAHARKVNMVSLDDFLGAQPAAPDYKLLKIDTEGFDCSIIRGAKNYIGRTRPVLSFEYNRDNMSALGEKGLDTLNLLQQLGYAEMALHDCEGRFFDAVALADEKFVRNIHDYADGKNAAVYYFDFTLFHEQDRDLALAFAAGERTQRTTQSG